MEQIKTINEKVIKEITKKKKKQNEKLFNMLDNFFGNEEKNKVAFCLIYLDPTKEERVPVITNVKENILKEIFKHFVQEMENRE